MHIIVQKRKEQNIYCNPTIFDRKHTVVKNKDKNVIFRLSGLIKWCDLITATKDNHEL